MIFCTEELTLATSYLDGVFPIRYETTAAIATALSNLVIHDLPEHFYDDYRQRVRGVTTESVLRGSTMLRRCTGTHFSLKDKINDLERSGSWLADFHIATSSGTAQVAEIFDETVSRYGSVFGVADG